MARWADLLWRRREANCLPCLPWSRPPRPLLRPHGGVSARPRTEEARQGFALDRGARLLPDGSVQFTAVGTPPETAATAPGGPRRRRAGRPGARAARRRPVRRGHPGGRGRDRLSVSSGRRERPSRSGVTPPARKGCTAPAGSSTPGRSPGPTPAGRASRWKPPSSMSCTSARSPPAAPSRRSSTGWTTCDRWVSTPSS